jgi:pyridoxine 5'-phosphate synthase PdxJ
MTPHRVELAPRSDGARYRRVTLTVDAYGSITLNAHEIGAETGAGWGLDEEEVTLSVASDQVARLAAALAAEILKGGKDAVSRLAQICEMNDVPCRIACWS